MIRVLRKSPSRQALQYARDPLALMAEGRALGPTFQLQLAKDRPWVLSSDPSVVSAILELREEDHASATRALRGQMGKHSLLVTDGDEHATQRRDVIPCLHQAALYAESATRSLARSAVESMPVGKTFSVAPYMEEITMNVILRVVFRNPRYEDAVREPFRRWLEWTRTRRSAAAQVILGTNHPVTRWDRERAMQDFNTALYEVIDEADRRVLTSGLNEESILARLVKSRETIYSKDSIRDQLVTLLGSGQETTATALTWGALELAGNPMAQVQLRHSHDFDTYVMKETLRLHPPVIETSRVLRKPLWTPVGTIEAGSMVGIDIYGIHRDHDRYVAPDQFAPDRWRRGGGNEAENYAPFGGGVRRCVGAPLAQMELRVVLKELATRATLTRPVRHEGHRRRFITVAPERGGRIHIIDREV